MVRIQPGSYSQSTETKNHTTHMHTHTHTHTHTHPLSNTAWLPGCLFPIAAHYCHFESVVVCKLITTCFTNTPLERSKVKANARRVVIFHALILQLTLYIWSAPFVHTFSYCYTPSQMMHACILLGSLHKCLLSWNLLSLYGWLVSTPRVKQTESVFIDIVYEFCTIYLFQILNWHACY